MYKFFSAAILVTGISLVILGLSALDSFNSDVSRFFTGAPTNKAVWMLIGGLFLSIYGLSDVYRMQRVR